jgi:type VI secretion system protein ImpL
MNSKSLAVALGLLTAAFVAFAWWVWAVSAGKMHWIVPVLCTALPVLVLLVVLLARFLSARRGASNLEAAIVADAAREKQQSSNARSAEIDRLRGEFERAVGALKSSRLADGHANASAALYKLPWYTIIGPPACGKTTVLRNSGLKFPYLPGTGDRLKGIGGTRNCDWWLTNHAILLDTAGRWTVEEEDRDEWHAFLDLLKRNRGDRPLNGVIAAISIAGDDATSLASADANGIKLLAGRMRERLDEITGRLGVSLPVYVLFTKCDLIRGFSETFSEMSPRDRQKIWGFTAPLLGGPMRGAASYFEEQLGVLQESLEHYTLSRMGSEVTPALLPTIYEFPAQLAALKQTLVSFVDELFDDSAYGETPVLRGAYFTSGTQEGSPADLLLEKVAGELNVRPPTAALREGKKSYFLHDMLMEVVFRDQHLATASHAELLRQRRRRRVVTSALFAGAVLVAGLPTLSFRHNLASLERTRGLVTALKSEDPPSPGARQPETPRELVSLGEDVARYEAGLPSLLWGFGHYRGDALKEPLARYYTTALKEWIARPLVHTNNQSLVTLAQQLQGLRKQGAPDAALHESEQNELRGALRTHLLLTTPREACTPKPLARKEWLSGRMLQLWEERETSLDKQELTLRQRLVSDYLEGFSAVGDQLAFEQDRRSVGMARPALNGDDKVGSVLAAVSERYGEQKLSVNELAGASSVLRGTQNVSGAFTRATWTQISHDFGSADSWSSGDEDWVFGCGRSHIEEARTARHSESFREEYLQRYDEQWRKFLTSLTARTPSNAMEAETMLTELVGRPGLLGTLFDNVARNTELPPPPMPQAPQAQELVSVAGTAAKGAATGRGRQGVADALQKGSTAPAPQAAPASLEVERLKRTYSEFVSFGVARGQATETPLEQYRRQLETVLMALKNYRQDDSKIEELGTSVRSALTSVEALLSGHAGGWSGPVLRAMLLPPLAGVANIALRDRGSQVERLWCDLVQRPYQEELAGRYPVKADSTQPVSLRSFERFYQPENGVVAGFVNTHLKHYVVREGGRYRFGGPLGHEARSLFREELLHYLNRTAEVTHAFFPGEAKNVQMPFRIRVRGAPGYSVTSFRVGATNVRYDSGDERWTQAVWPGEQPSLGAQLAVTAYDGGGPRPLLVEGEWGLFMILDERLGGRVLEHTSREITVGWKPKGDLHWIKVDFASDQPSSPLFSVPLGRGSRNLIPAPPTRIAHAGGGC